tara:strand:+ start:803 stop:1021 length:219 start_codon:yes stop_codon:yes gene_type:complete
MDDLFYKGCRVFIYGKSEPEEWDVREEGESWIGMRDRTRALRLELENENKVLRLEFAELTKKINDLESEFFE